MTEYVDFNRVIGGVARYLNSEVYAGMNDWQKILARMAVSRIVGNADSLRDSLAENPFVKTFGIMGTDGSVDVDGLMHDLREQIAEMGQIEISIPLFGTFRFNENDVDKLHRMIMEYR